MIFAPSTDFFLSLEMDAAFSQMPKEMICAGISAIKVFFTCV